MDQLSIVCGKCGHENERVNKFCANCGVSIRVPLGVGRPNFAPERLSKPQGSSRPAPPERLERNSNATPLRPPEDIARKSDWLKFKSRPLDRRLWKRTSMVPWVIGSVLSAGICVTVVSIALFKSLFAPTEILGQMTVTSEGGIFSNNEITIHVAPSPVEKNIMLKVYKIDDKPSLNSGALYLSPQYGLEGDLGSLKSDVTFTVPLPSEALVLAREKGTEVVVYLEEEAYAPSNGLVPHSIPLPTSFDSTVGTVIAVLTPHPIGKSGGLALLSSARRMKQLRQTNLSPPRNFSIRVAISYVNTYIKTAHFTVYYSNGNNIDQSAAESLAQELENQRSSLYDIGLRVPDELLVNIRQVFDNDGQVLDAQFLGSFWGIQSSSLEIDQHYFSSLSTYQSYLDEIHAIVGHELMHATQYLYGTSNSPQRVWLDEATAIWFESLAVGKDDYTPAHVSSDLHFFFSPLYFPPDQPNLRADKTGSAKHLDRKHGYGASTFFRYISLNKPVGDYLISGIYKEALTDPDDGSGALSRALTQNNLQASRLWVPYLQTLITSPQYLFSGLKWEEVYSLIARAGATLIAEPVNGNNDIKITYKTSDYFRPYNPIVKSGMALNGPDATLLAEFKLGGLSADGFQVILQEGFSEKASMHSGKITVMVSPSPGTGALVFALPRDGSAPVSMGVLPSQGNSLSVDNIGDIKGRAIYKGLLVVVYNNDDSVTIQQQQAIRVTVVFKILDNDFQISPTFPSLENGSYDPNCTERAIDIMGGYGKHNSPEENDLYFDCLVQVKASGSEGDTQTLMCHCITKFLREHPGYP